MQPEQPDVPSITASAAEEARQNGTRLIDVREQKEWDESHIPGAELRPMSTINDWYPDLPQDEPLIIYCRSGSRSANVIQALMTQVGHTNLTNLTGGIIAWSNADLPLTTD